ncbi:unnamed protein product [Schistocephalus solidus]|uniref:Uncharacterized protein n=1 Tax=Schistocephalus solidus TaxID=70667 RepID=A0A183SSS6_SCHSO|nr:unnamed protein product [Schistocephalus solidus]
MRLSQAVSSIFPAAAIHVVDTGHRVDAEEAFRAIYKAPSTYSKFLEQRLLALAEAAAIRLLVCSKELYTGATIPVAESHQFSRPVPVAATLATVPFVLLTRIFDLVTQCLGPSSGLKSEPHLRDDEAVIRPTNDITDRLGHQRVLSISPLDENIVQQLPAPKPRVIPRGLLPRRKAEEGVGLQATVFSTSSQKKDPALPARQRGLSRRGR